MFEMTLLAPGHLCLRVNVLIPVQRLLRVDDLLQLPLAQAQVVVVHQQLELQVLRETVREVADEAHQFRLITFILGIVISKLWLDALKQDLFQLQRN